MDPHNTTTMAVVKKRKKISKKNPGPKWVVVSRMLHKRIKDAATDLGVTVPYLRRLCKENGHPKWPGKTIRYMTGTGRNLMLGVGAPKGSLMAGLARPSQLAKVVKTKKEKVKELVTLNLIDMVGSSSASGKSN